MDEVCERLLGGPIEAHAQIEPPPKRVIKVTRKVRGGNDEAHRTCVFQLLHQRDHDAVQFSNVKRVTTSLSKRVKLVEQQDTCRGFDEVKELTQVDRSLTQIRTDHCVKPDQEHWQTCLVAKSASREAFSTAWGTVEKEFRTTIDTQGPQMSALSPFEDDGPKFGLRRPRENDVLKLAA